MSKRRGNIDPESLRRIHADFLDRLSPEDEVVTLRNVKVDLGQVLTFLREKNKLSVQKMAARLRMEESFYFLFFETGRIDEAEFKRVIDAMKKAFSRDEIITAIDSVMQQPEPPENSRLKALFPLSEDMEKYLFEVVLYHVRMKKGEYPISGRMRTLLEKYPADSSRKELLLLLDALVQFLNLDEEMLRELKPGTLENLVTQLPPYERLPYSAQEYVRKEIRELEELLPQDPSLALTRALDNYIALKEEYTFTSKKLNE